jgi:putative ABC transport system permease protein
MVTHDPHAAARAKRTFLEKRWCSEGSHEVPPIVWRNLRRKFRTFFTVGAIFFAFLLFGVLMAIRAAFAMGVDMAGQGRLMVIDKVSIISPLPASYEGQIKQIAGVTDITHANWFGGYYQEPKNFLIAIAVEPETSRSIPGIRSPKNEEGIFADGRARSSAAIPRKCGFTVGQRFGSRARSTAV